MRTQRDTATDRAPAHAADYTQPDRDYMGRDHTERDAADNAPRPEPGLAGTGTAAAASAPAALALLGGLWLVVSRLVFTLPAISLGPRGVLNGIVVGVAIALVAMVRLATPASSPMLSAVTMVLGGWMVAAPWVFGYAHWGAASRPVWSDVVTGAVIALVSLAAWAAGSPRTARRV
jgi:hypothetical protein